MKRLGEDISLSKVMINAYMMHVDDDHLSSPNKAKHAPPTHPTCTNSDSILVYRPLQFVVGYQI